MSDDDLENVDEILVFKTKENLSHKIIVQWNVHQQVK